MKPDCGASHLSGSVPRPAARNRRQSECKNMKKGIAILLATAGAAVAMPAAAQDEGFSGPWVAGVAGYDIN